MVVFWPKGQNKTQGRIPYPPTALPTAAEHFLAGRSTANHHFYYLLSFIYYLKKHLRPKTQVLLFYPIFMSTGFEIPLTLPEPVYCHILCL